MSDTNCEDFSPDEIKNYFHINSSKEIDDHAKTAQEELKTAIKARVGEDAIKAIPFSRLKRENGNVVIDASKESIEKFCDDVETRLKAIGENEDRRILEAASLQLHRRPIAD